MPELLIGAGSANWQFAQFPNHNHSEELRRMDDWRDWRSVNECRNGANCQFALPAPISFQKTTAADQAIFVERGA